MNLLDTINRVAGNSWQAITVTGNAAHQVAGNAYRYTQASTSGWIHMFTNPLDTLENSAALWAGLMTGNMVSVRNALLRLEGYGPAVWVAPHVTRLTNSDTRIYGIMISNVHRLWRRIDWENKELRQWVIKLVLRERAARIRADHQDHAFTLAQAKLVLQTVQRQAASGYKTGHQGRINTIVGLLGHLVTDDPVVKSLTGDLVKAVIDLGSVEDPIARLAIGFLLSQVIDRLGIDKPVGDLIRSLLDPLIGDPSPSDLHGVIMDISTRLGNVEGDWATFMSDGGTQVMQAGKEWAEVDSLAFDAALLAFAGAAVVDPAGTATALADLIRPVGTGIISDVAGTLGRI